jgi:hypothetical protein|tara:strand:+ start:2090 stop:2305 length:216 start_codon:yes stop_codon:yes gene_type:complete
MATDKQLLQWARQGNEIHKAPSVLHWVATVDGDNKVTKNEVYDELHKKSMDAGLCPNMKLSTEDTQVGDTL